jgi:hypothetical protein
MRYDGVLAVALPALPKEEIPMKKNMAIVLSIIVSFAFTTVAFAEIKEGLWEIKTSVEMKGMSMKMPATTARTCISKNDMVPKPPARERGQEQDCKVKEQKISGDTVTYALECTDKGGMTMEISGKMTYTGDAMEGDSTMIMKGSMPMEMSTKMSGKYIGPCTK